MAQTSDDRIPPFVDEQASDDAGELEEDELVDDADLLTLLDQLQEELLRGGKIPMTNKLLADEEAVYAVLDQIRTNGQAGIERAQWVVQHRTHILDQARELAAATLEQAAAEASALTSAEGIEQRAVQRAHDLIGRAHAEAHTIEGAADAFTGKALRSLRDALLRTQDALAVEAPASGEDEDE